MESSAFYTLAQIAITLTGFIAIMIALQHDDKKFSRLAVVSILGTTCGVVIFSFIPDLLTDYVSNSIAWRISCGTFGLYHLGLIINHQARQLQFKRNTPLQYVIVFLSLFPVVFLKLAVGLGFFMEYADKIFFLGLLWCIFIPIYLFSRIILEYTKQDD